MKKNSFFLLLTLLITSGFVSSYFEITKNLEIFNNIYREINTYYVDPIDPGELMHNTIDSMLIRLDPYTKYIPESEVEDFRFQTTGNYGGIGATIRKIDENIIIYKPYRGFPADKAGLKMGDILTEIDDTKIKDVDVSDVSDLLKGTPGTIVEVEIERRGINKKINITREKIHIPSVQYSGILEKSIGYVKLRKFTKNCTQEVKEAMKELEKTNELTGLILDLRSNPGGLLRESINLANLFINKDETVVTTNGKSTEWKKNYTTKYDPIYIDLPIVVLVNSTSASASEIVAGAIQDLDRGVVVGNTTFGKGLVQQSRKLSYNGRLKVTVAKYYTPSGRCIQDMKKTKKYNDYLDSETTEEEEERSQFFTRNKRVVYDGGGIDPDIEVNPIEYPDILGKLIRENLILKYGNTIADDFENVPLERVRVSDKTYKNFVNYIKKKGFEFQTSDEDRDFLFNNLTLNEMEELEEDLHIQVIEKSLKNLKKKGSNVDYLNKSLSILKDTILKSKQNDIFKHQTIIKKWLNDNLIIRHFYDEGKIKNEVGDDPYIKTALEVLNDEEKYKNILRPN